MSVRTLALPARRLALAAALLGLGSLACAVGSQTARETDFYEIQKHYTQMIRWSQFDRARNFVETDGLGSFSDQTRSFRDVRFTDYAIHGVEFSEDGGAAKVLVTYFAYLRTAPVAVAYEEQQEWRRPDGRLWRVRSNFEQRPVEPGEGVF
ncbi:hypothetical protein KJ059_04380 [Myxococcota bacterium]|nr:hypothetical protein [Myxococcota bacterium]MCZ7619181.1 hypothetical protein [Myxococcota bacterium]